jgi:EAL domain-containing protein (putative c-di-GMP-specific phosphodiesterase class I)/GGDEF domain-containing protein
MIYIADYFALGLVVILFMFFFDSKTTLNRMPTANKVFAAALGMAALNAIMDLVAGAMLSENGIPLALNVLVNSIYFFTNLLTTTCIAFFFIVKILEHTHRRHCMRNACIALGAILAVDAALIVCNVWTGILFYFDENGTYCRGPLNSFGYYLILAQMLFVLICYFTNKATAGKLMRRALVNVFPVIPICIFLQLTYPEIMLNSIIIVFTETVLFMTFMSRRHGVHSLTELNDRHRFFEQLNRRIAKKERFHIFLINLREFGAVNRKYGHKIGDEYLYQFAFSLEKILKKGMAFHMNGTVFAVVLPYTSQSVSDTQSGVLLDFLDRGIDFGDHHIKVKYIVSHYVAKEDETSSTDIYEIMEYSIAKGNESTQCYVMCNGDIHGELARRRYLRERLERIDAEHGFEVWYQPIKCLSTGKFCSMEALIRLREPDGKLISPGEFIPVAEQTGYINSITWFVLEQVCKDLRENPELADISVSINLPMAQLAEKGFVPRFIGTVDQAGIAHRRICLEFTERTILDSFTQTQSVMQELTDDGFRFYLDDFGVGYSNFNCLMQLPFRIIKIDSGFIHSKTGDVGSYTVVRALTRIFHDMELLVIAEGAETAEEVQALTEIGVDRIQGYFFSRPLPKKELLQFYRDRK